jgi:glycosyltransferase involved in cell wall biosynthesis
MPVYNYAIFIQDAIKSVLSQTLTNFELIVINDGSTDESSVIAHSYTDRRINVIDLENNMGCYSARNIGMKMAQGKYICVMDADDVCLPNRLEVQYKYLETNPKTGLIGTAYQAMNTNIKIFRESEYEKIKLMLLSYCYLLHPTCMIRSSLVKKYGLYYNESYTYASDYAWQVKASSLFSIGNINELLLLYRSHDQQISTSKRHQQLFFAHQIRLYQLSFLRITPTEREKAIHLALVQGIYNKNIDMKEVEKWICKLLNANKQHAYYKTQEFENFIQALRYKYIHHHKIK